MDGPLLGRTLPTFNVLHMTVKQALAEFPDVGVALSDRPMSGQMGRSWPWVEQIPVLGERLRATIAREDTRRPTMEVGVGVWTERVQRYYPLELIRTTNVIVDELDGRRVALAFVPGWSAPTALYVDARTARWDGDVLRFDNGDTLRGGVLYDVTGSRREMQRPMQLFTRWYGWALMFPTTEIRER